MITDVFVIELIFIINMINKIIYYRVRPNVRFLFMNRYFFNNTIIIYILFYILQKMKSKIHLHNYYFEPIYWYCLIFIINEKIHCSSNQVYSPYLITRHACDNIPPYIVFRVIMGDQTAHDRTCDSTSDLYVQGRTNVVT